MRKLLILVILISVISSCKKDTSPLIRNITLDYLSQSSNNLHEFRVSNNSYFKVTYVGLGKDLPEFLISFLDDTGWINLPWRCGTGLTNIDFNPGDSFICRASEPIRDKAWKIGIYINYNNEREDEVVWSQVIK